MLLEDYEVICPLNYNINPTINSYKARKKLSEELFILHSIDWTRLEGLSDKSAVVRLIKERKEAEHPNLLKFIHLFEDEPFKILYVVSEYCSNGNASSTINACLKEKKFLTEELICKIVYQVLCAIKTVKTFVGRMSLDEIFLDQYFNVKLLNFNPTPGKVAPKLKDIKSYKIARLMYSLCTLKKFEKSEQDSELKKSQFFYSTELLSLLNFMLKDHCSLQKNIDKILCNSTILLKSSQWKKEKSFFVVTDAPNPEEQLNASEAYLQKLRNLRERELSLQVKEDKLNERQHLLRVREKKVALLEKMVKEKLARAEVYLKRSRDGCEIDDSNKTATKIDVNTSFSEACDDSVVVTSRKLDGNILRPAAFIRTKSERKVRFKGHSPLKDFNYNRRRSVRNLTGVTWKNEELKIEKENHDYYEASMKILSDKSSTSSSSDSYLKAAKKLFGKEENVQVQGPENGGCRPISWTDGNKKYAFDLLRIMNGGAIDSNEIKHTYL